MFFSFFVSFFAALLPPSPVVKTVNREHRIPFEIKVDDPFYCASNQLHLIQSIQQLREGKGTVHDLIEDSDE